MKIPRPDPRMLDDLARVAGGAVNIFSGLQEQISTEIRSRMEEMAARLDLVPRDELDQAKGMIEKLRQDLRTLEARIDALDGKKRPVRKPAAPTAGKAKAKASERKPTPKDKKKK